MQGKYRGSRQKIEENKTIYQKYRGKKLWLFFPSFLSYSQVTHNKPLQSISQTKKKLIALELPPRSQIKHKVHCVMVNASKTSLGWPQDLNPWENHFKIMKHSQNYDIMHFSDPIHIPALRLTINVIIIIIIICDSANKIAADKVNCRLKYR